MDEAIVTVIEKYKNTWLSLKKDEMSDTLSGASEEDILAYKLSQRLSSLTFSDIERYLVKYPLWVKSFQNSKNQADVSIGLP